MAFDSMESRAGGGDRVSPMRIAHHTLLTVREKLELLQELKAGVTTDREAEVGFSAEEIDEAIQEVKLGVQQGQGTETILQGDR
jgi:hypothetical protein